MAAQPCPAPALAAASPDDHSSTSGRMPSDITHTEVVVALDRIYEKVLRLEQGLSKLERRFERMSLQYEVLASRMDEQDSYRSTWRGTLAWIWAIFGQAIRAWERAPTSRWDSRSWDARQDSSAEQASYSGAAGGSSEPWMSTDPQYWPLHDDAGMGEYA